MRMRAAVLEKLNHPLVVQELEVPNLSYGQVLVRVHVSGICGKQIGEISGWYGEDKYLPHLLGHEGGGVVEAVGPGVTKVKKGDHVVLHWRKGLGIESAPPKYSNDLRPVVGGGWVTTFNEYSVVSENRITVIPKELPFEISALMGCAVTTALGIINNEAQLKIGQSIVVFGCGGVGLNVIRGARMVSANPIIAVDRIANKRRLAIECGATHFIDTSKEPFLWDEVRKIVGQLGVDVSVECIGNSDLINEAIDVTSKTGKVILVGQMRYNQDLIIRNMDRNYGGKTISASQGGLTNPDVDIPRYAKLYLSGGMPLYNMVTDVFDLEYINMALDTIRSGEAGRCMIEMNP